MASGKKREELVRGTKAEEYDGSPTALMNHAIRTKPSLANQRPSVTVGLCRSLLPLSGQQAETLARIESKDEDLLNNQIQVRK